MSKQESREHMRAHRDAIEKSPEHGERLSEVFSEQIAAEKGKIISAYLPIQSEIDTIPLILDLIAAGHKVALPVTPPKTDDYSQRFLTFRLWDGNEANLTKSNFGTKAPSTGDFVDPDIFLIPLLAFDHKGNRMGYGQGHYDATLAKARAAKDILAIGVGYAEQAVLFNLPVEPHDQKLDMVLTPSGIYDFR